MAWTAGVYIVVPRLLAALGSSFALWRLSRQFVPPPGLASYVRIVLGELHDV